MLLLLSEIFSPGNTLTLVLIVLMPQIAYKESPLYRAKL